MPLNVQDAQQAVNAEAQKRNSKIVEKIPALIKRLAAENKLYIFNTSPMPHSRRLGSLGNFYVPACSVGGEVSEPLVIDGLVTEYITNDMNKMDMRHEEAINVANDVMLIGRGYTPDLNMERRGLFIHDSPVAPQSKILSGKKNWHKYCSDMVARADNLEKAGKREEISNTPIFLLCAAELGIVRPWCSESKSMNECTACGGVINHGVKLCIHCKAPTDPAQQAAWMTKQYAVEEKRGPGRPAGS